MVGKCPRTCAIYLLYWLNFYEWMRCFLDNSFFTDPTKKNYFINFISLIINNTQGSAFQIFFLKRKVYYWRILNYLFYWSFDYRGIYWPVQFGWISWFTLLRDLLASTNLVEFLDLRYWGIYWPVQIWLIFLIYVT